MSWRYNDYFPPSKPKAVKGGIKAESQRGGFGKSWWAKRWIAVLESFNIGARLGRGRSYARRGQVSSIDIKKGVVEAKVQGSKAKPYSVTIKISPLSRTDWDKLGQALSTQALFAAKLLAGEMPQDIEEAFQKAGLSLFPRKLQDLSTDCSCPDWSNPCKHIAAVYYLLGEEFDRDPFLIFRLRGMEREEFLNSLTGIDVEESEESGPAEPSVESKGGSEPKRGKATIDESKPAPRSKTGRKRSVAEAHEPVQPALDQRSRPTEKPQPLSVEASRFWNGTDLPEDFLGEVRIPPMQASLLKRLGKFPFWRGNRPVSEVIEPVYSLASQRAMETLAGEVHASEERQERFLVV